MAKPMTGLDSEEVCSVKVKTPAAEKRMDPTEMTSTCCEGLQTSAKEGASTPVDTDEKLLVETSSWQSQHNIKPHPLELSLKKTRTETVSPILERRSREPAQFQMAMHMLSTAQEVSWDPHSIP